jgi:hypothetical protein
MVSVGVWRGVIMRAVVVVVFSDSSQWSSDSRYYSDGEQCNM